MRPRTVALVLLMVFVAALIALPAHADGPEGAAGAVGSFEIDGNSADDSGAGEPIDWLPDPPGPPGLTKFTDLSKSKDDDSFGQGSKELQPGGWVCTTGGVPGKDDIVRGALAFRTFGGKQFVYGNWVRLSTNGDAHMDYEFHQSGTPNPSCPGTPQRTDGDILITFDTEQGGKTIFVRAFSWEFTGAGVGVFNALAVGDKHSKWDAAVNIAPEKSDPELKPGAFGELALNLSDTIGTIECGDFAGAYMKTRASTSLDAALKDRTSSQPLAVGNCPDVHVAKSASTLVANANDEITYTITATNDGNAPATGVQITDDISNDVTVTSATFDVDPGTPGGTGNCTVGAGNTITCAIGTLAASDGNTTGAEPDTAVVTIGVRVLPSACGTTLTNQAHVSATNETGAAQDDNASNVVSIEVDCGDIMVTKTPDDDFVNPGDEIGFTITVTNLGEGEAKGVVMTDDVPAGLSWSEDPDNPDCAISGGLLTCNFGTMGPAGSPTATKSVHIVATTDQTDCGVIDNTATVTTTNDGSDSDSASITVDCPCTPGEPDPSTATASGGGVSAEVDDQDPLVTHHSHVQHFGTSQTGPGAQAFNDQVSATNLDAGTVVAETLQVSSSSTVTSSPPAAVQLTMTEGQSVGVLCSDPTNLNTCEVSFEVGFAVARAEATPEGAMISSLGSGFENLKREGVPLDNVSPNTRINLPEFGTGSYIMLYETTGGTQFIPDDPSEPLEGGTFVADVSVIMVHAFIVDKVPLFPGNQGPLEIKVLEATAHAQFDRPLLCEAPPEQTVSGHAFLASLIDPLITPDVRVEVGRVDLDPMGGHEHTNIKAGELLDGSGNTVLTYGAGQTDVAGEITAGTSSAGALAEVANACVQIPPGSGCTVLAELLRSVSTSFADGSGASADDDGTLGVNVEVDGSGPIGGTPPPNTVIMIPGVGTVILNEQICDNGETPAVNPGCDGPAGHAGLTVRAVHVMLLGAVELIVAEAHSDATFVA